MAELTGTTGILNNDMTLIVSTALSKDDFDKYAESNDNNIKQLQSDNLNLNSGIKEMQVKQALYQVILENNIDDMKKHLTDEILDNHEIIEDNNSMIDDLVVSLDQFKRSYDTNNENNRKLIMIFGITNIITFICLILIFITLFTL